MNCTHAAAALAALPAHLLLPIEAPRAEWPGLLDHAAAALQGRCVYDSETLALELRAIAEVLRAEVLA
ncbi:hypothetical protein [uncultured Aquimonas sp.]|uniref:hypothetical protein n=1 Tax=uncultured Aquimonas sp. TaxID=385483 RepID=UPI00086AE367|nr:hypothetical protein [uncultured Aquimonas sp.]ODU46603.1 MAG: hypothetical protein ABS96_08760 [Xanthomonadaceae bacterium SCN 69-123]